MSHKDACWSQVQVSGLKSCPLSLCCLSILDWITIGIHVSIKSLSPSRYDLRRTGERADRRKLKSSNKEEEKADCDWQMTKESETPERPRSTPTGLKACRQTHRGLTQISSCSSKDVVKQEGIQIQYAQFLSCTSFFWLAGLASTCRKKKTV